MNAISKTVVDEINAEHDAAQDHAGKAIEHAQRAGQLLLDAKADLKHGEFQGWVESNLRVSVRQAQRYMRAAQGKPMTARGIKNDTVSHLPSECADGSSWLPSDESVMLRLSLKSHYGRVWDNDVYETQRITPLVFVQKCPNAGPQYDVILLDGNQLGYFEDPVAHWGLLSNIAMMVGGRGIEAGGMIPMFHPYDAVRDPAKFHAQMGALPWERLSSVRGWVRSLVNIKVEADGGFPWKMDAA